MTEPRDCLTRANKHNVGSDEPQRDDLPETQTEHVPRAVHVAAALPCVCMWGGGRSGATAFETRGVRLNWPLGSSWRMAWDSACFRTRDKAATRPRLRLREV